MTFRATNYLIKTFLLLLLFQPFQLFAVGRTLKESPIDSEAFITMFVGLIAVIGLIFLVAVLSRKMKLMHAFTTGYQIKNLASLALTNREKVCLIEIGGKQVLLGIAPGRVNQLYVFDELIDIDSDNSSQQNNVFSKHFKKALGMASSDQGAKK
ncbi:MAG: hypothetical protein COA74_04135 [Gammaproteobacteria bacterium]|nr:MAG: hypothetical protein COA74_04135 [Gammaproteobacteria bacterium]